MALKKDAAVNVLIKVSIMAFNCWHGSLQVNHRVPWLHLLNGCLCHCDLSMLLSYSTLMSYNSSPLTCKP